MAAGDRACDRYCLRIRHFLVSVAHAVRENPEGAWNLEPPQTLERWRFDTLRIPGTDWDDFVPTSIYLRPASQYASPAADVDAEPQSNYTGLKVVDEQRTYGDTRLQKVSVRSYFALPALACEIGERVAYLVRSPYGGPLRCSDWSHGAPGTLTSRERRRMGFIPPEERVALAAVAVAAGRPVVAFSPDGDWPHHSLIEEVARRLRLTILRRRLAEIPGPILRHIRCVQYRVPRAAEFERGREG